MSPHQEIQELLARHRAVLVRQKKHSVWRLPNGRTFILAKTESDHRTAANCLATLREVLGVADPNRGRPGDRRERIRRAGRKDRREFVGRTEPDLSLENKFWMALMTGRSR